MGMVKSMLRQIKDRVHLWRFYYRRGGIEVVCVAKAVAICVPPLPLPQKQDQVGLG